jgi:hypothetical protein
MGYLRRGRRPQDKSQHTHLVPWPGGSSFPYYKVRSLRERRIKEQVAAGKSIVYNFIILQVFPVEFWRVGPVHLWRKSGGRLVRLQLCASLR